MKKSPTSLELGIAGEPHDQVAAPAVANSSKGGGAQGQGVGQHHLHPLTLRQTNHTKTNNFIYR